MTNRKRAAAQHTTLSPARLLAYRVLREMRIKKCYLEHAWQHQSSQADVSDIDASFARLLATVVVTHQGSLDRLINSVLKKPSDIKPNVRDALRISFCELYYLQKPAHVAVSQGVELVRSFAPRAQGVANYALRRAAEQCDQFPFGDVCHDVAARALQYGFPEWIVACLDEEQGELKADTFLKRSNDPAPIFFVVNSLQASQDEVLAGFEREQIAVAPIQMPAEDFLDIDCFVFDDRTALKNSYAASLLARNEIIVSDRSAQIVASYVVGYKQPQRVLEIGAGRGTKTLLMQNIAHKRFGSQLDLITVDSDGDRFQEFTDRIPHAGATIRASYCHDATDLAFLGTQTFDVVFIDAPCTGVGTLRRHPEIRWRVEKHDVERFACLSVAFLQEAARRVSPGGLLSFATCTVFSDENERVIDVFLSTEQGQHFTVERCLLLADLMDDTIVDPVGDVHFLCGMRKQLGRVESVDKRKRL